LDAAKFCASAIVPMGPERLSWRKQGAEWMLVVIDGGDQCHPIRTCSVKRRVDAAASLPALLSALQVARAEMSTEVERATAEVRSFIERVASLSESEGPNG